MNSTVAKLSRTGTRKLPSSSPDEHFLVRFSSGKIRAARRPWLTPSANKRYPSCYLSYVYLTSLLRGFVTKVSPCVLWDQRQRLLASSASSSATAPRLLSGWLAFPHLGDWTQEGQPASQSHPEMACRVAVSQSRAAWKPRSAKPAPPS